MKKSLLLGFLFLFSIVLRSQSDPIQSKTESKRLMDLSTKLEGTYQVQVLNSRDKTEIPLWIMDSIVARRDLSKVVYFPIKNNVRVMVLPTSVIEKKGFTPLPRVANISN